MYLFIDKYEYDPTIKAVVYHIEIGIQKAQIVHAHKVQRRYSALQQFDSQIRPLYKDSRFLQPFPPKKFFGNREADFLVERCDKLQKYLTNLVRVAGVVNTPAFMRCFDVDPESISDM
jgi:hypothetical protein